MSFWERVQDWFWREDQEIRIEELNSLRRLCTEYNLDLVVEKSSRKGTVTYSAVPFESIALISQLMSLELKIYPHSIIESIKLKRIVLCSNLKRDGLPICGGCIANDGELFISVDYLPDNDFVRRTFHHELFHSIDYFDDQIGFRDPLWQALNEADFKYSHKKFEYRKTKLINRPGFMTNYSMSAVSEDKAELYSFMICHYSSVFSRAKDDHVLRSKAERMRELLLKFSPGFDDAFWKQRERCTTGSPDDQGVLVDLKIWTERVVSKEMWFVARTDSPEIKPIAFYSREDLMNSFALIDSSDLEELNSVYIRQGVKISVRILPSSLRSLGLS